MKPLYHATVLALFLSLTGCRNKETTGDLTVLDIENAIDNRQPFDLSEISAQMEFIPLDDSSPESLIGDISEITESKSNYYLSENQYNRPIKVFDKTGKFVSTRGMIGRGPDEYITIDRIVGADYDRDNVYIKRNTGIDGITAYDAGGRIFARVDSVQDGRISFFGDRLLLYRSGFGHVEKGDTVTLFDQYSTDLRQEVSGGSVPYAGPFASIIGSMQTSISITRLGHFISNNGRLLLIKQGRNDTLFSLRNDLTPEPLYKLEMGAYSPPDELFGSFTQPEQWERYFSVNQVYDGNRYFIAQARITWGWSEYLIFDKEKLSSGGFTAVGPDGSGGLFIDGIRFTPCYIRDNRLVGWIRALDVTDNHDNITDPGLKALAATLREDSNPVLVVVTLKQ